MKKAKRIFSAMLAVMLLAALLVIPASAAGETYTITINNTDHTYKAYQIFTGTLSGKVLSDVEWGNGVNEATLLPALQSGMTLFASSQDAEDVARALEKQSTATVDAFAKIVAEHLKDEAGTSVDTGDNMEILNLDPGYYIVIDKGTDDPNDKEVAFSRHMVEVVANVSVTPKASAASISKTVSRTLDLTYTEAISASFGDTVYFKLDCKLPSHLDDYSQYYYEVVDTLPTGMSFDEIKSVAVVNGTESKAFDPAADDYDLFDVSTSGQVITINFDDIKADILEVTGADATPTDEIVIKYSAKLNVPDSDPATNDDLPSVGGEEGKVNKNTAALIYSNNPNVDYNNSTGTTSPDAAYVYCYNVTIDKFDGATKAKLENAEFVLYRPTIGPEVEFALVDLNNNLTGWTKVESDASKLKTDASGKTMVNGIASGTYYIKETAAPDSYNKLANPIMVTITATASNDGATLSGLVGQIFYNSSSDTVRADADTGVVTVGIANNAGAVLPTTGGIGTTIFYVIGAVLVIGAATVLVSKKRKPQE